MQKCFILTRRSFILQYFYNFTTFWFQVAITGSDVNARTMKFTASKVHMRTLCLISFNIKVQSMHMKKYVYEMLQFIAPSNPTQTRLMSRSLY